MAAEARQGDIRVPPRVLEGVANLVREAGEGLESVVYYEHPLTGNGLLLVLPDHAGSFPDLLARIFQAAPRLPLHCLRPRELFQLALPGYAAPALSVDDQPHLAHCVKFRSAVLHGRDCRAEVPLPARPDIFLRDQLRGCRKFFRTHVIKLLYEREYRKVVTEVVHEARRSMSIALQAADGWRVDLAEVPDRYAARFGTARGVEGWRRLVTLAEGLETTPEADLETAAYEACWLFEGFLKGIASEALESPPP
jgi:hypothetical protein